MFEAGAALLYTAEAEVQQQSTRSDTVKFRPQGEEPSDMAHRVQLALYDLSRGMAKAMSMAILGKQIDGEHSNRP